MPRCCVCLDEVPRANFSCGQLKKDIGGRSCKKCTQTEAMTEEAPADEVQSKLSVDDWKKYGGSIGEKPRTILHISQALQINKLEMLMRSAVSATLVAFDAEWSSTSPESDGVHVLQLAFPDSCFVYVLEINGIGAAMPNEVYDMFSRPDCKVVGWGADSDRTRLPHTSPRLQGLKRHDIIDFQMIAGARVNFLECGVALNAGKFGPRLDDAVRKCLNVKLSKDSCVRMSDWRAGALSLDQVHYAAMDAWVTLRLYLVLSEGPTAPGKIFAPEDAEAETCVDPESKKRYLLSRNQTCDLCGLEGLTSDVVLEAHRGSKKCTKRRNTRDNL